jgi:hypothetical protein
MWTEAAVTYFQVQFCHVWGTKENHEERHCGWYHGLIRTVHLQNTGQEV